MSGYPQALRSTISGAILSPQYGPGNAASRAHRKDKAQRSLSLSSLRPTSEMSAARLLDIKMLRSNSRPHTRSFGWNLQKVFLMVVLRDVGFLVVCIRERGSQLIA